MALEVKICSKCKTPKPVASYVKNAASRDGLYPACKDCSRPIREAYRKANREKQRLLSKKWYKKNKAHRLKLSKDYYRQNKVKKAKSASLWRKNNKDKSAMYTANYRASKARATPSWFSEFDEFVIAEAFSLATERERFTGKKWHVDHVVPVNGKVVCGLHSAHNIQVIPGVINMSKQNRFDGNPEVYHRT